MTPDKYPLPGKLQLSPERIAQAEADQILWQQKGNSPFAASSPFDLEMNRAAILIRDLEDALRDLRKDPMPRAQKEQTRAAINSRLAESYAILGRFDKAAELESDELKIAEYRALFEAVERDDADVCDCPEQLGDTPLSNDYVLRDVYSVKHQRVMPVMACRACGHLNAAPITKDLAKMREARRKAVGLVGSADKGRAKNILRGAKMTTADIIK